MAQPPPLVPDGQAFQAAINYFAQHSYDHKGGQLSDEILDTPAILGMIASARTP